MSYFGLIVSFVTLYKKDLRIGTPIATIIPHSIYLFIGWTALFFLWVFVAGLPVGPGAATYFTMSAEPPRTHTETAPEGAVSYCS